MTTAVALAAVVLIVALMEARWIRRQRAERRDLIVRFSKAAGIAPTIKVARELGWVGDGDIQSDGDVVMIRLAKWRPFRRR